ncbi:MAG TPA: ABC transporter ATP-binding protein [Spirochaetales bacterium]|nr:ABC transporter ATP-binding protein [Spirochaetales bacterium]
MTKLFKYLKPYWAYILTVIVLLFVQANLDLSLPDYMSKIVNYGIQQGGIDNPVPKIISEKVFKQIIGILPDDKRNLLLEYYEPVSLETITTLPLKFKDETQSRVNITVYQLKQNSNTDNTEFTALISKIMAAHMLIQQMQAHAPAISQTPNMASGIPQSGLPQSATDGPIGTPFAVFERINEQLDAMGNKVIEQMAIAQIRLEYESLSVNLEQLQMNYIIHFGVIMILVTLGSMLCIILVGFLASRTAAGAAKQLRNDVYAKVINFTNAEYDNFSTASLITRTTNDITQLQAVTLMSMRMLLFAPIMGGGGVIRALDKAPSMAWIIGIAVLVLIGVISIIFSIALPKFQLMQKLIDRLNLVARENLSGLMVVRAFNREPFEEQRFKQANTDLTRVSLFINRVMVFLMPFMMILLNILSISIIWVGAHKVADASIQVGDMMAFMQYAMQIVFSFIMLSMMFIFLPRAAISGKRVVEVLETKETIKDPEHPVMHTSHSKQQGTIEFRNVCFRYPKADTDVLCNISFTAPAGKTIGIIGPTGSGKTTLLNLIPRFYDVTSGAILIDGTDIRTMRQKDLRNLIGYVPQRSILFSGTVAYNLRFADEGASDEKLTENLLTAQADFIFETSEKLLTPVSQGGNNFSGGQKQRLAIARALTKQCPIYLFDDSFSALDFKTDAALRRALNERTASSTRIIVAQRVATIMNADLIIVLDDGHIVGQGTHKELLESCEAYQEIVSSQFKGVKTA